MHREEGADAPLRVAIYAALDAPPGTRGGSEQALLGLVRALSELEGPERYLLVTHPALPDWLEPYRGGNQQTVVWPVAADTLRRQRARRALRRLLHPLWQRLPGRHRVWKHIVARPPASSDGFLESLGVQVVHFPWQHMVQTGLPTVFTPHDLQHRHWPSFFTETQRALRETVIPWGCREAEAVVTLSHWVKEDLIREYGIPAGKIYPIHPGPPTAAYPPLAPETLARVRAEYALPARFAFYPAQTWPHKNHARLLAALQQLRDHHALVLPLVCTGKPNVHTAALLREAEALGLAEQVRFLGFVAPDTLRALYREATFLVFPSLFEGCGLPLLEAFHEGTPIASSDATSLPELGAGAALLFDATSVDSIAQALHRMASDAPLRQQLVAQGQARARHFTWDRSARAYRALYRHLAGRELGAEEKVLLQLSPEM